MARRSEYPDGRTRRGRPSARGARLLASLLLVATLAGSAAAAAGVGNGVAEPVPPVFTVGVDMAGVPRTALVVMPPKASVPPRRRPPLLVVLHGVGMRGNDMRAMGFDALAARRGVVVAYPDAWRGSWNDGRPGIEYASPTDVVDDVAFLRSLIGEIGARAGADTSRVAVVGFSNGALMTGRLACDPPAGVVAVGLVAGTVGQGFAESCRAPRALPVVVVAGTGDAVVPYDGGQIADFNGRKRGRVAAVGEFLGFWSAVGRCRSTTQSPVPEAAVPVSRIEAQGCDAGSAVVHYRIDEGGHDWYRIRGFDTTGAVWGFVAPWLANGSSTRRPWTTAT